MVVSRGEEGSESNPEDDSAEAGSAEENRSDENTEVE